MIRNVKLPVLGTIELLKHSWDNRRMITILNRLIKAMTMYCLDAHLGQPLTSGDNIFKPKNELERQYWEEAIELCKMDVRKMMRPANTVKKLRKNKERLI